MSYLGHRSLTLRHHFILPTLLVATLVPAVAGAVDGATRSIRGEALPLGLMGGGFDEGPGASLPPPNATPITFSLDWSGDRPSGLSAYYSLTPNVEAIGLRHHASADELSIDIGSESDLAEILDIEIGKRIAQWRCLTEALYFEARGESLAGQVAVAEVILNRVESKAYPDTVCGVVHQGANLETGCQFSFMCDGKPEVIRNRKVFENLGKVAWAMLQGKPRLLTGEATHYHTTSVSPRWAAKLARTVQIGEHIFYRRVLKLSGR